MFVMAMAGAMANGTDASNEAKGAIAARSLKTRRMSIAVEAFVLAEYEGGSRATREKSRSTFLFSRCFSRRVSHRQTLARHKMAAKSMDSAPAKS